MLNIEKMFFIGIDLGWKEKRTTGICVLEKKASGELLPVLLKDVFGKDFLKTISPYLKSSRPAAILPVEHWTLTKVIAIDAPLTLGRGKGKMRLYEKFLSTKIFRKERVNPLPPALISKLSDFAREVVKKLEKKGFVLNLNLIETFPTFVKKACGANLNQFFPKSVSRRVAEALPHLPLRLALRSSATENQRSALICAIVAFLHFNFQTRYLGYKDGFLFLPEMAFWKKDWQNKFYQAWQERPRLKYRHLITNIFQKAKP